MGTHETRRTRENSANEYTAVKTLSGPITMPHPARMSLSGNESKDEAA
jgi:hypothetical protein